METTMTIDDVLLFMCEGNETEAKEAFSWLFRTCWDDILRFLNSRESFRGLSITDKENALSTAFRQFWDQARAGKIKDIEKDPRALLVAIAKRRATDLLRKATAQKRQLTQVDRENLIAEAVDASSIRSQWKILETKELAKEVMEDFKSWLKEQSPVCRRTAEAMVEFFPDLAGSIELYEVLRHEVMPPPTVESVKRARTDVLEKFKAAIESKYERMWKS